MKRKYRRGRTILTRVAQARKKILELSIGQRSRHFFDSPQSSLTEFAVAYHSHLQ
jgi:hypothetical protein